VSGTRPAGAVCLIFCVCFSCSVSSCSTFGLFNSAPP
jgi:hypothetical protein